MTANGPLRLDVALVTAGLVSTRHRAQLAISSGRVRVNGVEATKSAQPVGPDDQIELEDDPWVSRAAHKLLGALDDAHIVVPSRCLDAGASTGGFTQVLLSRGAQRVYAVDVGHGQLAGEVAADARVTSREGLNIKDLTLADLDDEPVSLVVADLSFISLTQVLPVLLPLVLGDALLLVKPQFEVGRGKLGNSGVVRDLRLRTQAVDGVVASAASLGWREAWRGASHLPGVNGNVEYFIHMQPA
ncbi:MAG: TlyA family RNA methyltransferase [Propionibacteriaceae bacterium]|nr:TlyA family RNA methyltransferase [Propionibacteriaceae bacterium]